MRLLPDILRLIPRLARDQALPRGVRVRLWLLLLYLASPIDLIPDFIPVLGYADAAIIVAATLRSVARHAGPMRSAAIGRGRRMVSLRCAASPVYPNRSSPHRLSQQCAFHRDPGQTLKMGEPSPRYVGGAVQPGSGHPLASDGQVSPAA